MTEPLQAPPYAAPPNASPPDTAPWGYVTTLAWAALVYIAASAAGALAAAWWFPDSAKALYDGADGLKDARFFSFSTIAACPVMIALLIGIARLKRWSGPDYLALRWPSRREAMIGIGTTLLLVPLFDLIIYLAGGAVVTSFQTDIYRNAQQTGVVIPMWLALVVAAPVAEETAFRGFIYRGWVRSERGTLPAVLALSALFAMLHLQYNWFGVLQVFGIGLLLAWARWRSGSTLLTMLMHGLINLYSTVQTVVVLDWTGAMTPT